MAKKLVRFDWAMKRLLRNKANFDILEGFLSELLHEDFKIKQILESEGNKETEDDKFNRVDILVENKRANWSSSKSRIPARPTTSSGCFTERQRSLWSISPKGSRILKVKKVYSVNIVYFDLGQGMTMCITGRLLSYGIHSNHELELSEKQKELFKKTSVSDLYPEYYVIKTNRFNEVAKDTLDEWIYFLKTAEIKDEFTAKGLKAASQKLDILKLEPADRKEYDRYMEAQRSDASFVETVKLEISSAIREVAENALIEGASPEFVAKITGLDMEDVQRIAERLDLKK
jgi:hypothetical protein